MVDCVRKSTSERDGVVYQGTPYIPPLRGVPQEVCSQTCVSDTRCGLWNYTPGGLCTLLIDPSPKTNPTSVPSTGAVAGRVVCEKRPNYLRVCVWILVFTMLLLLAWYLVNDSCKKK